MIGSERSATAAALSGAVVEVARAVEGVQLAVTDRVIRALGPTFGLPARAQRSGTRAVHATIRATTRLVVITAAPVLERTAPASAVSLHDTGVGAVGLAALGSAWGDRMTGRTAALAAPMTARLDGRPLRLDRDSLASAYPAAASTVVVFVHGLGGSELAWGREESFATRLTEDTGVSCVHVRYTTGRHISDNGCDLDLLLTALHGAWPIPVQRLVLVGHSMGGLVLRSAVERGTQAGSPWLPAVSDVFHLGSPHHGAPLERVAAATAAALRRVPETAPLGRLLDTRSVGVKDLRHGAIVESDWRGVDVDRDRQDHKSEVPLLPTARHHFVAATLTRRGEGRAAELIGDLLVPPSSATGRVQQRLRPSFPPEAARHVGRAHHLDLLDHPEVYALLLEALTPSCRGSR